MYQANYVRTAFANVFCLSLFFICLFLLTSSPTLAASSNHDKLSSQELTLRKISLEQLNTALDNFNQGRVEKLILHVNFHFDKSNIIDLYQKYLNKIGGYLSSPESDGVQFTLEGHTDGIGTDQYNVGLSMRRAYSVREYFVTRYKLRPSINLHYYGESQPIKTNASAAGRRENRRTEIILQRPALSPVSIWPADSKKPVTFSPDGRYIVSVTHKGKGLKQWNLRYACRQRNLEGLVASPYAIVYSPNGRLLMSAGADNSITLWDSQTGLEMIKMTGHQAMITEAAISPNGTKLLSGSFDTTVRYWDLQTALPIHTFTGHSDRVLSVSISADGNLGASGANNGELIIWDIDRKKLSKRIRAHKSAVTAVKFSPMGRQLFTASADGVIKQWNVKDASVVRTFTRGPEQIVAIDFDDKGRRLLAATQQQGMVLWDVLSGKIIRTYSKANVTLTSADLSPKAHLIAATDSTNSIHIWETDSGKVVNVLSEDPDKTAQGGADVQTLPSMMELTAGQQWTESHTGMKFIWVPGGCYQMGCGYWTDSCSEHEKPVHENCVDGFWLAQSEITQGQWTKIMEANPSRSQKGDNYPVEQISWQQTQDYICRMNTLTGLNFRLPSEAEWEFACRNGGKLVKFGHQSASDKAEDDTGPEVTSVNELGLYNMSGGVWEWNLDLYSDTAYTAHEQLNPVYKGDNAYHFTREKFSRVERGGVWDIGTNLVRCAHRDYDEPGLRSFFLGARLLLTPF